MDHALRRSRLIAALGEVQADGMLVTGPANVRYLTGFSGSNGQVVVAGAGSVFLTDGRYDEQSRREVPDLERRVYRGALQPAVAEVCAGLEVERLAFEPDGVTYRTYLGLAETGVQLVPTGDLVERLRWAKDDEELARIGAAQAIADRAFGRILGRLAAGVSEQEVALLLDVEMRRAAAEAVAFDTIVAFGEQAAEPHHRPNGRPLSRGDVIKLDFGCVVEGYHSDMTRTVAFGEPPAELREVYGVVRAAQRAGVEAVRAGQTGAELDAACRKVVAEAGYGSEFTHPLGHGVGLEIHEGPWLRGASEDVLPAGTVVTVEPGVYLPGVGGVRIEDMVEVTLDGSRVISDVGTELLVL